MEAVLDVYEFIAEANVVLVHRGRIRIRAPSNVEVIGLPTRTIVWQGPPTLLGIAEAFLVLASYFIIATPVAIFQARKNRCNLIHAKYVFPEGILGYFMAKLFNTRFIITAEGSDINELSKWPLSRTVIRFLGSRATFISVSKQIHETLEDMGVHSVLLPNSVDVSELRYVPFESKENLIMFLGRLDQNKRPTFLLASLDGIREFLRENAVRVYIVGDGPLRHDVENEVRRLDLSTFVTVVGEKSRSEALELLARAKVYVSCSLSEGLSFALLEAMGSGCVAVASDIEGNSAIIRDGENGILYDRWVQEDLGMFIMRAFGDVERSRLITKEARREIEDDYNLAVNARQLLNVYESRRS